MGYPKQPGQDAEAHRRLAENHLVALQQNAALREALADAIRTWSFGDGQQSTHSWHDREDWFGRHEIACEIRKADSHEEPTS